MDYVTYLKQSDMLKCPHAIMMPEHYNSDGSCKCFDPTHLVMEEWGYEWSTLIKQWIPGEDES